MHKKLAVSLLLGVLGFLGIVARAADPVTIETSWNYDFYYTKCTGVTACTADVAGLGAGVSISTQNVVGFSWSVLSNGADSTFTISQVTRTYPPVSITGSNPQSGANVNGPASGFNDTGHPPTSWYGTSPLISTTTAITAVAGIPVNGQFQALVTNPTFHFSGLTASATTYLWVEIGRRKNAL